jgi:hypothetical protein
MAAKASESEWWLARSVRWVQEALRPCTPSLIG